MMRGAAIARGTAIAIAVGAVLDPVLPLPRSERAIVRVVAAAAHDVRPITDLLTRAGFVIDATAPESATVLVGNHVNAAFARSWSGTEAALWVLDTTPGAPNVRIADVDASASRLPGQTLEVRVVLESDGVAGQRTELSLEQSGIPVASVRHQWTAGERRWTATLRYLPPGAAATRLRVRAAPVGGETSHDDNAADVAVPPARGAIRALIVEAAVTWPAMFVRRALEGDPAFAVSAVQRAANRVATRAGSPPASLRRDAIEKYEVVVVGGPDQLTPPDLAALRWFVEERGGVVLFVPDQRPSGRYVDLVGVAAFAPRVLEAPVRVGGHLSASELLIPASLPPAATVVAADDGRPVVFSARRGAGAVIFSGALDAWRNRAAPATGDSSAAAAVEPFARFWRELLAASVSAVPPALAVSVSPAIARPGERARIAVRLRGSELPGGDRVALPPISARAIATAGGIDEAVRLWPTAEPGVYEGEWRAGAEGTYNVSVTAGELRGDASLTVAAGALRASGADPEALALAASATGGQVFPIDRAPALVEAMKAAYPARRVMRSAHPMRSPWWMVPFVGLLCLEWAVRRTRGLP